MKLIIIILTSFTLNSNLLDLLTLLIIKTFEMESIA